MIPRDQQANDEVSVNAAKIVSPMTEYVVTRWYRPPELMLAPNGCYDGSVDMWSVGCILGELISRKPMFPGTDFMDQLTRVFKVVSIPDKDERGYTIEKDALKFLQSLPPTPENAMERLFKSGPPLALDLMKKLLCFNPKQRISADEALAHPFFDGVKEEWGEIAELKLGHSLEFAFEQQSLPLSTLRQFICDEVRAFRERDDAERKKRAQQQADSQEDPAKSTAGQSQPQPQALRVANDMPAGRGFAIKGCEFNVPPQYKPLQVLGEGSYGIVWYVEHCLDASKRMSRSLTRCVCLCEQCSIGYDDKEERGHQEDHAYGRRRVGRQAHATRDPIDAVLWPPPKRTLSLHCAAPLTVCSSSVCYRLHRCKT
ncbi:hypothetical protein PINS_up020744 [Pythium insidiosum]|nr:hypothetical protein PINS_up020744 [Pythium insidiosum]